MVNLLQLLVLSGLLVSHSNWVGSEKKKAKLVGNHGAWGGFQILRPRVIYIAFANICVYVYIYMHTCTYIYIYIHI